METERLNREVINLLKRQISVGVTQEEVSALLRSLARNIDQAKAHGEKSDKEEALYEDVMWLNCEILK